MNAPQASFHPTAKENEMKLQIQDEGLDSNREGGKLFHFLMSLTHEKNYAHNLCFIFNEVATKTKNYPR